MPQRANGSDAQKLALDTSDLVLTVLRDAARLAPIPYLKDAAGLALEIAVQDNKDAFRRLASDACGLVYAILSRNAAVESGVSPELLDNLQELLRTLTSIERFAKSQIHRNIIIRMIKRKSDLGTVQQFRETLRQSLDLFGLKSTITIQEHLVNIASQQGEILAALQEHSALAGNGQRASSANGEQDAARSDPPDKNPALTTHHIPSLPSAPHIQASHGKFKVTSVGRDQTIIDSSNHVSNTNSGNTTTTITKDSNNDSSVRIRGPGPKRHRKA